jgi:hypothetical protein
MQFAEELGRRLMRETKVTLITGGMKFEQTGSSPALDGVVTVQARKAVHQSHNVARRIVAFLPTYGHDDVKHGRVSIETVICVRADRRTRRYAMVVQGDAVISGGGSEAAWLPNVFEPWLKCCPHLESSTDRQATERLMSRVERMS